MSEFVNWAGTCNFTPHERAEPASETEVVALIRKAIASGKRVKVVGAGHSWSDIAATDGILVSLDRMSRVLVADTYERPPR